MQPDWLPALVLLDHYENNWDKYLKAIYKVFKEDFVYKRPVFQGKKLGIKRYPLADDGKEATFWHMISEGKKEEDRLPDLRRCERIRWPKPIIEHSEFPKIKIWENKRRGEGRVCIWFEEVEYLVILAKRKGYILFWTAYPVFRSHRKRKLNREYEEYLKAGDAPQGGTVTPSTTW